MGQPSRKLIRLVKQVLRRNRESLTGKSWKEKAIIRAKSIKLLKRRLKRARQRIKILRDNYKGLKDGKKEEDIL